jgi:hypothetical protein
MLTNFSKAHQTYEYIYEGYFLEQTPPNCQIFVSINKILNYLVRKRLWMPINFTPRILQESNKAFLSSHDSRQAETPST